MNKTFWQRASAFPPILVRLLARHPHGPPMDDAEISVRSGLSVACVHSLSQNIDWAGIDLPTMFKFLTGCALDFEQHKQMERVYAYLRSRPTWQYLRKSPDWKTHYQPLFHRYRASVRVGK